MVAFDVVSWEKADREQLQQLWQDIFGDPAALTEAFFELLPDMGGGYAAVSHGDVLGAAYIFTDLGLSDASGSRPASCVYAVATKPEHRGKGIASKLCADCADFARKNGLETILVCPAEESLGAFYSSCIGTDNFFRQSKIFIPASCGAELRLESVSTQEYNRIREEMLAGTPHLALSDACMEFEHRLCSCYEGGLFLANGYPLCMYIEDGKAEIKELLSPAGERNALCAAIADKFKASGSLICMPDDTGRLYLAADSKEISPSTVFNLLFD